MFAAVASGDGAAIVAGLTSRDCRNDVDAHGNTLLHAACVRQNNEHLVEALLLYGVDVNASNDVGNTALHVTQHQYVQLLLDHNATIAANGAGETPLHRVAMSTNSEDEITSVCRLLLDAGADANAVDGHGRKPIYYTHKDAVAALLVARGASYDDLNDNISAAAGAGSVRLCREMLNRGVSITGVDANGQTALHRIVASDAPVEKCKAICELLLQADASIVDAKDSNGCTALSLARKDAVADVLIQFGAQVSEMHLHGDVLFKATAYLSKNIVRNWVEKDASLVNAQDNFGRTMLHILLTKLGATREKSVYIMRYLLSKGARTDIPDGDGRTFAQRANRLLPTLLRRQNQLRALDRRLKKRKRREALPLSKYYIHVPERLTF